MNWRLKMNSALKCWLGLFAVLVAGSVLALDNQGWLAKARECAEAGRTLDSDETKEDGVYCIALAAISDVEGKTVHQKVGEAELVNHKTYAVGYGISIPPELETFDRR